jgi:hypothetical protein
VPPEALTASHQFLTSTTLFRVKVRLPSTRGSDGREIWLTALVVASVLSINLKTAKAPVG